MKPKTFLSTVYQARCTFHDKAEGAELIWQDADGTLFEISGKCEEAVLLYAAESIQKK